MEENKLEKELKEKLPSKEFRLTTFGGEEVVVYYDYHGVTFRDSDEEQRIANNYVRTVVAEKVGYLVRIIENYHSGNGHCTVKFERILED